MVFLMLLLEYFKELKYKILKKVSNENFFEMRSLLNITFFAY